MYIKNESTMKLFKVFHKNFNVDDDETTTTAYTDTFQKYLLSAFRAESKAFHFHLLTRTTLLVDVIWILSPVFTVQCYVSSIVI